MSFSMMGTRGQVRMRTHPKGYGQGPRGEVDKHEKRGFRKRTLDATRKFQFERPRERHGVMERASAMVRRVFARARGNR
jgi:hypothetical protein